MNHVSHLAAAATTGNPVVNIIIFTLFVVVTLVIVIRVSRRNTNATEYFTAGHAFSGRQNGVAIAGDYLSAASFLGIAGAIGTSVGNALPDANGWRYSLTLEGKVTPVSRTFPGSSSSRFRVSRTISCPSVWER